jgi:protein involved in polysaccharide export with SLBB domain
MISHHVRYAGIVGNALRALVVLVSMWVCLGFATSQAVAQGTLDYKLGSGDKVRVTVFGHEDLSGEFEVDGSGHISLPLIRDMTAKGLTVKQLEQKIIDRLKPDYLKDPSVSVDVLNYRPFYIFGEVNNPGSYAYVSGMTVVNAIAMAGGFTYRAKKSRVEITRANDPSKTPKEGNPDTPVLPGDVIEVPERFF